LNKTAYVERWARLEYQASRRFTPAVEKCIANKDWPKSADLELPLAFQQDGQWIEWDAFWNLIKNTAHTDQYRRDWEQNGMLQKYCKKIRQPLIADERPIDKIFLKC
jgi:hypothetical protein